MTEKYKIELQVTILSSCHRLERMQGFWRMVGSGGMKNIFEDSTFRDGQDGPRAMAEDYRKAIGREDRAEGWIPLGRSRDTDRNPGGDYQ